MIQRATAFFATQKPKLKGILLLLAGILIGAAAQATLLLAADQPGFWDLHTWLAGIGDNTSPLAGLLLYLLAGWLFITGLLALGHTSAPLPIATLELQKRRPNFGFWLTSLGLAVFCAVFAAVPSSDTGYPLAITWCLSILMFIISVALDEGWQLPALAEMEQWFKAHGLELAGIALLLAAAFVIRFWNVELQPYSFVNDEGEMGISATCILARNCQNMFGIGWAAQPILTFLPYSLSIALLGNTAIAVRLVSVLTGTLAVLAVYLFAREAFDKKVAWVAALVLAALPPHIHFSRLGVDNVVDSLSAALLLWLLLRGIKRGSTTYFLAAGVLSGLCMYTYPGTRLAPVLGVVALGAIAIQKRGFLTLYWRKILVFLLAAIITAAPILGTFGAHPEVFNARMARENIFTNGILDNMEQGLELNAAQVVIFQFSQSSLVFIATGAPSNFYNSPQAYLPPLAAIFLVLGLIYTLWRLNEPRFLTLFLWFFAAIVLGSTITGGPPTTQRMMMSMSAAAILVALGLVTAVDALAQEGKTARRLGLAVILVVTLLVGYQGVNFYFGEYTTGHFFEDPTNELTYETRTIIAPLHENGRFYLLSEAGAPYLSFANFPYFAPDVEKDYLNEVTPQALAALPKDKDVLFIATSYRTTDLELLAKLIPGGEWNQFNRRNQPDQLLFTSYRLKKELLQAYKP